MDWLKHTLIDVLAVIVIALAVFIESSILKYVVFVYTGLMVFARLMALLSGNFRLLTEKNRPEAPVWFYHVIYFLSTLILLLGQYYYTATGWLFIWVSATYVYSKKNR